MSGNRRALSTLLSAVLVGVIGGVVLWWWLTGQGRTWMDAPVRAPVRVEETPSFEGHAGLRYAEAVRDGDCATALQMLWWVRERLTWAGRGEAPVDAVSRARARLCEELLRHGDDAGQLRREGIEDRYVFVPGAVIEAVALGKGREGLARPAQECLWLEVTYPPVAAAPKG